MKSHYIIDKSYRAPTLISSPAATTVVNCACETPSMGPNRATRPCIRPGRCSDAQQDDQLPTASGAEPITARTIAGTIHPRWQDPTTQEEEQAGHQTAQLGAYAGSDGAGEYGLTIPPDHPRVRRNPGWNVISWEVQSTEHQGVYSNSAATSR